MGMLVGDEFFEHPRGEKIEHPLTGEMVTRVVTTRIVPIFNILKWLSALKFGSSEDCSKPLQSISNPKKGLVPASTAH